jgi:hypothetical protein
VAAEASVTTEVFRRVTSALDAARIPYMLTGSFASSHWGASRATQDIDLVIDPTAEGLTQLVRSLPAGEYYADLNTALEAHARRGMFNVIDLATGWKLDFIVKKARPFSAEEFGRRKRVVIDGLPLFIATAEDTVVSKLEWAKRGGSTRQIEDAAGIIRVQAGLDHEYIRRWVRELGLEAQWAEATKAPGR